MSKHTDTLFPYTALFRAVGMVLVLDAGYLLVGDHSENEVWLRRFAYEYLKDARTFALIVIVDHGYRWFWRRLQGEARLLDPPDDGSATGQEARPGRFRSASWAASSWSPPATSNGCRPPATT